MLEKRLDSLRLALSGCAFICLGVLVVWAQATLILNIFYIFMWLFLISGFLSLFDWLLHLNKFSKLLEAVFDFGISLFLHLTPNFQLSLLPWLFGALLLLHAMAHVITLCVYLHNRVRGRLKEGFMALFYFMLGCSLFITPTTHADTIMLMIGIYLILYGLKDIKDVIIDLLGIDTKNKLKRKVHIPLPDVLAAMVPHQVLMSINRYLEENTEDDFPVIRDVKENIQPNLEVLIHVSDLGFGKVGHVDLCYEGTIISYGNYDADSFRMHELLGDGVLFLAKKEDYIPFCIEDSQKTIFGFGLTLTEQQKNNMDRQLKHFFENLIPWHSPYELAEKAGDKEGMEKARFYASRLYKHTHAKMFKFKSGRFKTYFVLTNNCVSLADELLGKTGVDIVSYNGVITPGTYYDYFSRQFMIRGNNVVTRTIYHKTKK